MLVAWLGMPRDGREMAASLSFVKKAAPKSIDATAITKAMGGAYGHTVLIIKEAYADPSCVVPFVSLDVRHITMFFRSQASSSSCG